MEVAIAPRLRAGIPRHLARSVGTYEATLFAKELIDRDQYEAAMFYQMLRLKYLSAIDEPHEPKEPRRASNGGGEEAHEKFCEMARGQWLAMVAEIQERQIQERNTSNLFGALDGLIRGYLTQSQLGDLRIALNTVHRFRLSSKRRAA